MTIDTETHKKVPPGPATSPKTSFKARFGTFLYYAGLCSLMAVIGAAVGYYAGARQVRWLPTMLKILLATCIISLFAIIAARTLQGSAIKTTPAGIKLRRRVIFCATLAILAILARLGVYYASKPSPLTSLSTEQYNEAFYQDLDSYLQCDKIIETHLIKLEEYAAGAGEDKERLLTADEEKLMRGIWTSIYDCAFTIDQIRVFHEDWYRFDPSPVQATYHHRSFLLTFAAELSLYEKTSRFIKLITQYPNVVKFLNTPSAEMGMGPNSFSKFRQQFQGSTEHARILAGENYLRILEKAMNGRKVARAANCSHLLDKAKLEIALIDAEPNLRIAKMNAGSDIQIFKRSFRRIWFPAQKGVAKMIGDVRLFRRIGTYLITEEQQTQMNKQLAPGDILVSRKNWHLSNAGLPGFWPHAILYVGTKEKMDAYFNDEQLLTWLKELTGRDTTFTAYLAQKYPIKWKQYTLTGGDHPYRVIESVKPGVIINTLAHACGDYIAAMRPQLSKKAKAQAILSAFSHIGKPYDYDFDFATDHALVCTELVWRSYRPAEGKQGLNIPLVEIGGRKTLPANQIVKCFAKEHAAESPQLAFVYFIDASEKQQKTFVSKEEEFLKTCKRKRWTFAAQ